MTTLFRTAYPIDFNLLNDQDQQVIFITDKPLTQEVKLEITNTSPPPITLAAAADTAPGPKNYHFELRFRKGTLDDATRKGITVDPVGDWVFTRPDGNGDADSLFLLSTKQQEIAAGGSLVFKLGNLSADAAGGSRGSRAELRYRSNPADGTTGITGHRETHFNIVNHSGQKHIPLHVDFVGSNTILNDGQAANTLTLRIMNISNDRSIPLSGDLQQPSKLILSFDTQASGTTEEWALATADQAKQIELTFPDGFTVTKGNLGSIASVDLHLCQRKRTRKMDVYRHRDHEYHHRPSDGPGQAVSGLRKHPRLLGRAFLLHDRKNAAGLP